MIARLLELSGAALGATSPAEAVAAVLGLAYVVLVIGQRREGWIAALLSTCLYLDVFFGAGLYMQAALQVFYIVMAVYGWWAWRRQAAGAALEVSRASPRSQLAGGAAVVVASVATATWLSAETGSAHPYLDSLTSWASVFATWLMARKKLENWGWWLIVDALIVVLCWQQALYASMILYMLYLVLVVIGWRSWVRDIRTRAAGRSP